MKLNGNTFLSEEKIKKLNHRVMAKNPLRDDTFEKDEALKIKLITEKFNLYAT